MAIKNPYSPLVVPGDWTGTMRNFGLQLSRIITDIYLKITKQKEVSLTINEQELTSEQKAQVRTNLGLGTAAVNAVANNLTTTDAGSVLDARQGKTLDDGKLQYYNSYPADMNSAPISGRPYSGIWTTSTSSTSQTANAPNVGGINTFGAYFAYATSTNYQTQFAIDNTGKVALRGQSGGTWGPWGMMPPVYTGNISANGNKTFTLSNNGRFMVVCFGGGNSYMNIYLVYVTNAGAIAYKTLATSADLTITTGTNSFKIANSGGASVSVYITAYAGTAT